MDRSILTSLHAFSAARAAGSVHDLGVLVHDDVDLAENILRARLNAFPAGFALPRIEPDMLRT